MRINRSYYFSNQQPATSNQQPATSNQQPATSNQQPATSNQQPATSNQRPAVQYLLFYKPYGVLSQFTPEEGKRSLQEFGFPKGVYPVGRLDYDSEGLLLLTDDNAVKHRLTDPKFKLPKTYLVQIERIPSAEALQKLRTGVVIEGKKTRPAEVRLLSTEPELPPRSVPVRFRKTVPTAWIELTLREGRNRQVRKMTAAVGHPTLRLLRIRIGNLGMQGLREGEWVEVHKGEL